MATQKLGQPVPPSYFFDDSNKREMARRAHERPRPVLVNQCTGSWRLGRAPEHTVKDSAGNTAGRDAPCVTRSKL